MSDDEDFPEELFNEIPDPKYFHMSVENDEMSFSFGGMEHYEVVGRLHTLLAAMEAGEIEAFDEE